MMFSASAWAGDVMVTDPWVREAPLTAQAVGGFMVIENHGVAEKVLIGAESSQFKKVELHETVKKGDMMVMEARPNFVIPSHGKATLAPGGLHLMLISPVKPLKEGEKAPIVLKFKDGETVSLEAVVRKGTAPNMKDEHAGHAQHGATHQPGKP
ncbi:MAG: copper chaperone PCu(A)C [Magnetococcales bacterium]|nr:copper chaperone PCu(A)C [Magnetococcales bacterium]